MFPDELLVIVIPTHTFTMQVRGAPMNNRGESMEVYLGKLVEMHRTRAVTIVGGEGYKEKFTVVIKTTPDAPLNESIAMVNPRLGWKGEVIVLKHDKENDKKFVNIEEKDLPKVNWYLSKKP